jgi:DNA-binding winged helix-turn-helix (wHTH) protein
MAVYRFHECRFDSATGELRRGPVSVLLRPQPAAVLACLLDRAGTLVSREHLHRTLWPAGTHVQFDQGLNSCLKQLRAALGDRRIRPRFIETLTRRGYRFVPDVRRLDDMPAGVRRLVVGSIEVSDSRDSRTRSFAAGLDAELMLALSALAGGSLVIARPGVSRETRAVPADAGTWAAEYLLEIFVRRDDAIRVTARLLTSAAVLVWAGKLDGPLDAADTTEQTVARWLTDAVRRHVLGFEPPAAASDQARRIWSRFG